MTRTALCPLLALNLLLLAPAAPFAAPRQGTPAKPNVAPPLAVTVQDENGEPAAGATISRIWLWNIGTRDAYTPAGGAWKTDGAGVFRVGPEGTDNFPLFYPFSVFATDAAGKRGAVAVAEAGKPVTLRLQPLVPVTYRLRIEGWEGPMPFLAVNVAPKNGGKFAELASGPGGTVPLPPGEYALGVSGLDVVSAQTAFTVKPGQPLDLGTVTLTRSALAQAYGKPAPKLTVTDARGVSPAVTLSDYRGKWVLIDFWGFWCPPCVKKSLPEAVALYDKYADRRDRFEILAFHCIGANNFAELRPKLARLVKNEWKNRDLPFPILLDATGETMKTYGVTVFPSTVLIDPEGRVVRGGSLKMLEEKLSGGREATPPGSATR